jgi:nitrate reductase gamma subunit
VLLILWVQLVVGLITLPYSLQHTDGSVMLILADWAQRIVTLRPVDATPWPRCPGPTWFTSCWA